MNKINQTKKALSDAGISSLNGRNVSEGGRVWLIFQS